MASTSSSLPPRKRPKQSGQKRAPYVPAACDSCHGRKLRCSGGRPCERCSKQSISCSYPAELSTSVRSPPDALCPGTLLRTIDELQTQLSAVKSQIRSSSSLGADELFSKITCFEEQTAEEVQLSCIRSSTNDDEQYYYAGPTSSTYSLGTADSRLLNVERPRSRTVSYSLEKSSPPVHNPIGEQREDSLLGFLTLQNVEKCINAFQEVFGVLHPVPHLQQIRTQALQLLRATRRSLRSRPSRPGNCGFLEMFKCIIAIGHVCMEGSQTPLSRTLFLSLEPGLGDAVFARTITHEFRILLLLVALYYFSCDDLALGTRALMIASRSAVEAGLYRYARLQSCYPNASERGSVINLLWSLFVLDMQFNYAAGLPNIMNEQHIDLPRPVGAPYLAAMVDYVLLGSQAWTSIAGKEVVTSGASPSDDAISFFRYQLDKWREQLDPAVRFERSTIEDTDAFSATTFDNDASVYQRMLLYLRSNQIQILVLRPILMHSQSTRRETNLVNEVIELAQHSIRALCALATRTETYHIRKVVFNHFLGSSLALLFMAAAHDVERRVSSHSEASQPLLGNTQVLREGLELMDRSHATKLISCFERPRTQLTKLGILGMQQTRSAQKNVADTTPHAIGVFPETINDASGLPRTIDFIVDDVLFDAGAFAMDWSDAAWMESLAPFGVPSWM